VHSRVLSWHSVLALPVAVIYLFGFSAFLLTLGMVLGLLVGGLYLAWYSSGPSMRS